MITDANTLRDLRAGILLNLYRVAPRGRTAAALQRVINPEVECTVADVEAQLAFLGDKVERQAASPLAPGLDPFWKISPAGMAFCEQEHLL
jgi:hypothetical protein